MSQYEQQRRIEKHQAALAGMKPAVDNQTPQSFSHLQMRSKKKLLQDGLSG